MVKASFAYPDVDVTLGDVIAILGSDADEVYALAVAGYEQEG